jgi:hypothetical protein
LIHSASSGEGRKFQGRGYNRPYRFQCRKNPERADFTFTFTFTHSTRLFPLSSSFPAHRLAITFQTCYRKHDGMAYCSIFIQVQFVTCLHGLVVGKVQGSKSVMEGVLAKSFNKVQIYVYVSCLSLTYPQQLFGDTAIELRVPRLTQLGVCVRLNTGETCDGYCVVGLKVYSKG